MTVLKLHPFKILMVFITSIVLFGPGFVFASEQLAHVQNKCISCHKDEEAMPEDFFEQDIHFTSGILCADCHGGDPTTDDEELAMSAKRGFTGAPSKEQIPAFCGKCHSKIEYMRVYRPRISTDQVQQYFQSVHGKKLKTGDKKVADCTSCHSAHRILPASDPRSSTHALNVPQTCRKCHSNSVYMKKYNIPTDQFEQYAKSVHGRALFEKGDLASPACNDCHGNHGAAPPGLESISHVCGTCHLNNMQFFSSSKMGEAFVTKKLHGCEECHGNHGILKTSDNLVGTAKNAVCVNCHEKGDDGFITANALHNLLRRVVSLYDTAVIKHTRVRQIGMDDIEIGFLLQEAKQSIVQARTLIHTFDTVRVGQKTTEGYEKTKQAVLLADNTINDFYIRRYGFGAASFFITILIIALFFKIREIDKKNRT